MPPLVFLSQADRENTHNWVFMQVGLDLITSAICYLQFTASVPADE